MLASCWFTVLFVVGILLSHLNFEFNTGSVLLFAALFFVGKQKRKENFSQRFHFIYAAFQLFILLGLATGRTHLIVRLF